MHAGLQTPLLDFSAHWDGSVSGLERCSLNQLVLLAASPGPCAFFLADFRRGQSLLPASLGL